MFDWRTLHSRVRLQVQHLGDITPGCCETQDDDKRNDETVHRVDCACFLRESAHHSSAAAFHRKDFPLKHLKNSYPKTYAN